MKKLLSVLLVFAFMSVAYAPKFTITVRNEIDDKDDPICLKAANVSIGTIEDISCEVDQPIGQEFKVTLRMTEVYAGAIASYLESLEKEGKKLDSFTFGNSTRSFSFEAFLSGVTTTCGFTAENLHVSHLPSNKGFALSELF